MAFNDEKKFSDVLRLKSPVGIFDQGDPKAKRDRCWSPFCGNWVEDLRKDNRCHEETCDRRLWSEAVKRNLALYLPESNTHIGDISRLLVEPTFDVPPEYWPHDICMSCTKELKRPGKDVCNKCYMDSRSQEHNKRRKMSAQKENLTHRIKGLGRFSK